jgi:hypothetical protein
VFSNGGPLLCHGFVAVRFCVAVSSWTPIRSSRSDIRQDSNKEELAASLMLQVMNKIENQRRCYQNMNRISINSLAIHKRAFFVFGGRLNM